LHSKAQPKSTLAQTSEQAPTQPLISLPSEKPKEKKQNKILSRKTLFKIVLIIPLVKDKRGKQPTTGPTESGAQVLPPLVPTGTLEDDGIDCQMGTQLNNEVCEPNANVSQRPVANNSEAITSTKGDTEPQINEPEKNHKVECAHSHDHDRSNQSSYHHSQSPQSCHRANCQPEENFLRRQSDQHSSSIQYRSWKTASIRRNKVRL